MKSSALRALVNCPYPQVGRIDVHDEEFRLSSYHHSQLNRHKLLMDLMIEDEVERIELLEEEDSENNEAGFLGAFR
jgi:hypothetical protein